MNKKFVIAVIAVLAIMFVLIIGSNFKKDKQASSETTQNTSAVVSEAESNKVENTTTETTNTDTKNEKDAENTSSKKDNKEDVNKKESDDDNKQATQKNEKKAPTGNTTYYIKVNYQANAVTIYEKDDDGYYTEPVKAMICSCGTATPKSGVYKTSQGYEWGFLEGGTYGRYSTRIKGGIMFHSVPYVEESEDTLEYWEFDKLGTTASLGCVRLCVRDCKWIFDNCEIGTPVEFYADSNPGPLGKPTMPKISDNEECRDWDPTDPSPDSPWNK